MAEQQNEGRNRNNQTGIDVAETGAALGGGVAGAAVGSMLGPIGTVAGAVAGGAMADEAVENAQAGNNRQKAGGAGGAGGQNAGTDR